VIHDFDIRHFFRRNLKQILLGIFLFWFIFAALIFAEDSIALWLADMKADPLDRNQYIIRFIVWMMLTPAIIFLAVKFPVRRKNLIAGLSLHFLFALLTIAVEFFIEVPIVRLITFRTTGLMPPYVDYAAIFFLKLNIYLLLYFVIAGTTYLLMYIESNSRSKMMAREAEIKSQQLQTQLSEAKLSLLKTQLDPHFLFNTHHSIVSLMLSNENEKAITMLTKLSDLLRLSLEDLQQTITLEKEIQILRLYLDIQQVRFRERLKILFDIKPETVSCKVPSFILQPLVENAIKHCVNVSSGVHTIQIHSDRVDDNLVLRIENDGSHIEATNYREGIGISNTKERLHQLYNGRSRFELNNLGDNGVAAIITIPVS